MAQKILEPAEQRKLDIIDKFRAEDSEALRPIGYGRLVDLAQQQEREDIVNCIRAGSWSGTEEIVAMIRARK